MSSMTIECPHCRKPFELTEALASPLLEAERKKVDAEVARRVAAESGAIAKAAAAAAHAEAGAKLKASETALAERDAKLRQAQDAELAIRKEREQLEQAKRELDLTVQRRVDAEKKVAAEQAVAVVAGEYATKLKAAEAALTAKDGKLKAAEEAELQARKAKQEAEEAKRQAELTVARRMDEERTKVREDALRQRDEEHRLKLSEKDKQLSDMRQQIEELRRKGESSSQQLVGDVLELDLLEVLRSAFPDDQFERIKKGHSGADILQTVRSRSGLPCGKILWESKHTKAWSDAWLSKLRDDQRALKADVAALMTETLPEGVRNIDLVEEVWVTGIPTVVGLATTLRKGLIETANARRAAAATGTVKDLVYGYLTGQEFRQRVRAAIEPIVELRADLEREKRSTLRQWAAREKQLDRITNSMAGMYGDLQGIVGASLPAVEELVLLEAKESAEEMVL